MGKYDAQNKWAAAHTTRIVIKLNRNTDADLLEFLETAPSKQGAIKEALRAYIESKTKAPASR